MKSSSNNTRDNVFYDTFDEMMEHYSDVITDIWEDTKTVCMAHTDASTGLFNDSDIIIVYGEDNFPSIVTERIFKKNYTRHQWYHVKKILRDKTKYFGQELGFNIRVTVGTEYIDYIHYKEEWWEWAKKIRQSSQQ